MEQSRMVRLANKIENVRHRAHVGRQRVSQIGIEIGKTGAINDQVQFLSQKFRRFRSQSQPRLSHVTLDDFHALAQKTGQIDAVTLKQRIENRRALYQLLE